jgi:hypothetical protein
VALIGQFGKRAVFHRPITFQSCTFVQVRKKRFFFWIGRLQPQQLHAQGKQVMDYWPTATPTMLCARKRIIGLLANFLEYWPTATQTMICAAVQQDGGQV